jgi:3D (Asp-Asp-Asp) domain-containing protein
MFQRTVYENPPPRRRIPGRAVPAVVAVLVAALVVAGWASTSALRATHPLSAGFLDPGAPATLALAMPAQEPPVPQQPAPQQPPLPQPSPNPLDQLDRRLAEPMAPAMTEAMVRERETRAAADAFPVARRIDMSSTMYCLRGEMRTGVRTRDGMAAGDPGVLPLGSVVRVSRPDGRLIGIFVIMDTGGAIRGNRIDLYTPSCREAEDWGRHPVVVEVLDIGKRI